MYDCEQEARFSEGKRDRIEQILNASQELNQPADIVEGKKQQITLKNDIVFEKVHFAYPTAPQGQPDTLQGISFKVKAGTTTALVGPSGSGKSTIIQLLLRLYDPKKGNIFVDGENIKSKPISQLRNSIGYIPQDSLIFSGSLDDNILAQKSEVLAQDHLPDNL